MTHQSIDPSSKCPGELRPLPFHGKHGWEHRGRYRCVLCGYRTTQYPNGQWTTANPLSPRQRERIAAANKWVAIPDDPR
jgi:rubredoxin